MTFVARPAADPGHDPVPGPAGAFVCSLWLRSLCLGALGLREAGGDLEDFLEEVPLQAEDLEQSEGGQGTNIGGNGGQHAPLTDAQPKKRNTQRRTGRA